MALLHVSTVSYARFFLPNSIDCFLSVPVFNFDFEIYFSTDVIGKITMVSDIIPVQSMAQTTASNTRTILLTDIL